MAIPTLANPPNPHQLFARRSFAITSRPKSQPYFRVFPTGGAEYHWRITALATNQTISLHKSLSFALRKCKRLNNRSDKGAGHEIN